jgi:hypothetical protein
VRAPAGLLGRYMVRELTVEEAHCQARQLHHLGATPASSSSSSSGSRKGVSRKAERWSLCA